MKEQLLLHCCLSPISNLTSSTVSFSISAAGILAEPGYGADVFPCLPEPHPASPIPLWSRQTSIHLAQRRDVSGLLRTQFKYSSLGYAWVYEQCSWPRSTATTCGVSWWAQVCVLATSRVPGHLHHGYYVCLPQSTFSSFFPSLAGHTGTQRLGIGRVLPKVVVLSTAEYHHKKSLNYFFQHLGGYMPDN